MAARFNKYLMNTIWLLVLFYLNTYYFFNNRYYSWPINVNVEIRSLRTVQFPAVTWCNLNPIRKDFLNNQSDLCDLIGGQNPECKNSTLSSATYLRNSEVFDVSIFQ